MSTHDPALVEKLREKARLVRTETVRQISIAKSGHYGSSFSCAELFAVLYYYVLRYDPKNPAWPERDRFILSKGHAAIGLYPVLADVGFFPKEWLDTYTRLGSPLGDHPDMRKIPGIDFSSGSLGHGLSIGVGMALGGRLDRRGYRVYVLLGDGELNEGQVWAAAMSAAHFKLGNLAAIVDRNRVSVDGLTEEVMSAEPIADKWRAFGWTVTEVDGHDLEAVLDAFAALPPVGGERPSVIIAKTVTGKGVSFMEGDFAWHLGYLAPEDEARARRELDTAPHPPTPSPSVEKYTPGEGESVPLETEHAPLSRSRSLRTGKGLGVRATDLHPDTWDIVKFGSLAKQLVIGEVLAELVQTRPDIVVLTADLKYSNRLSDFARAYPERFFEFGIAEHNMVSAAAGLAAVGKIPYVASYASFLALLCCEQIRTDIAYPNLPVRLIGTHAGIAMGFYGTSHHATEDIAILRSMANMTVFCPADGAAIRAGLIASLTHPGPIYFRLSRGREPDVYAGREGVEFKFGRAITLRPGRDVTIIANGVPLSGALEAAEVLAAQSLDVRVIDMHTVKPIDRDAILLAARETGAILTVEEHNILGGLGGAVAEVLAEAGVPCRFKRHGLYDEYSLIGPPIHLYEHYRLNGVGIAQVVREFSNT
jgi:transketolase